MTGGHIFKIEVENNKRHKDIMRKKKERYYEKKRYYGNFEKDTTEISR